MSASKSRSYRLDDLPRFSPWPARLLGLEPWEQRHKTPQEVSREYELEKWGPLFSKVQDVGARASVEEVDSWVLGQEPVGLCSTGDAFELLSPLHAHQRHVDLIEETLRQYLPASALCELGCGYGSVILRLAKTARFEGLPILAGEYTPSGVKLTQYLAAAEGLRVTVAPCDLALPRITDLEIPPGAIIFTSFAVPYVPKLSIDFITALSAWKPKAVVHFEPCYEHCDGSSLIGLMRKRYIETNGYNTNLIELLQGSQRDGKISILEERPAVFGANPLLPVSIVAWAPR